MQAIVVLFIAAAQMSAADMFAAPQTTRTNLQLQSNGNANYLLNPVLTSRVANGLFVIPRVGLFDTPHGYAAAYNSKWGDFGAARVPAGTQINFGNFECNQTTAQTLTDTGGGGNHCFGGTIDSSGTGWNEGVAINANISGAGVYYGVDLSLNNSNARTSAILYWANCIGRSTCGTAFAIGRQGTGDFSVGIDLGGHNVVRTSSIDFAGARHAVISGATRDLLRIAGGGTAGGMIIAGSTVGGTSGPIRFRQFATSQSDAATIDPTSGDIHSKGKVSASRGFQLPTTVVELLPHCNSASRALMYFVTDARSVTYRAVAIGGGAMATNVTCDGTSWLYM